ncbi:AlpA family phage regulatory protein [Vibrio mexicanus]|uniref:helix-turn-helix transcriptional regulator n=1 Tax=Vibrio mexicanus TaxID=1004326 RepID=UPI0009497A92
MSEFLTINDIVDTFCISRTTLWRLRRSDTFPRPAMISARSPRWSKEDILKWVEAHKGTY